MAARPGLNGVGANGDWRTLRDFVARHRRLFVLTGAGVSTESGIPDYRDAAGAWKHAQPVQFQAFRDSEAARRRYWARSMLGWPRFAAARPGPAHRALARLGDGGRIAQLVTQNVDGLHQHAGSENVIDLHGRLDRVGCLDCDHTLPRAGLQRWLERHNPGFAGPVAAVASAPDGDAQLEGGDDRFARFRVPACPQCGGLLKPAVVFFGESVPRATVARALERLERADALLAVGTSLMVYSGYRFCRAAAAAGLPVAALNLGRTRADDLLDLKVTAGCGETLTALVEDLVAGGEQADRR